MWDGRQDYSVGDRLVDAKNSWTVSGHFSARAFDKEHDIQTGRRSRLSPRVTGLLFFGILCVLAGVSLVRGELPFSLREVGEILWGAVSGRGDADLARTMIICEIRLPRIVTALVVGAALGVSGAIFQGLLLNPLADPYTLGVSSGAALGAALVITAPLVFPGAAFLGSPWALTAGAFVMSLVTLAAVVALARDRQGHLAPTSLILAGVILSAIMSAAISFVKYLAGDQVASIVFWLLGSFQARTWSDALVVSLFFLPAMATALWAAVDLNIMTLGVRSAETMGVNTRRVRFVLLLAASLAAAAAVSVAGIIGFVGLIVPHVMRLLAGPDHRSLLPLSALGGAVLLLGADTLIRTVLPGEIPVGVLTALLAGPAFLAIFRRRMGRLLDE